MNILHSEVNRTNGLTEGSDLPILKTVNIKRVFGRGNASVTALRNIDFQIPKGAMVALKGRFGSVKKTLLNILGALDQPTEGKVKFQGQDITEWSEKQRSVLRRTQIGLVFQLFGLIPLMSAYENVEFGQRIAGVPANS